MILNALNLIVKNGICLKLVKGFYGTKNLRQTLCNRSKEENNVLLASVPSDVTAEFKQTTQPLKRRRRILLTEEQKQERKERNRKRDRTSDRKALGLERFQKQHSVCFLSCRSVSNTTSSSLIQPEV